MEPDFSKLITEEKDKANRSMKLAKIKNSTTVFPSGIMTRMRVMSSVPNPMYSYLGPSALQLALNYSYFKI